MGHADPERADLMSRWAQDQRFQEALLREVLAGRERTGRVPAANTIADDAQMLRAVVAELDAEERKWSYT